MLGNSKELMNISKMLKLLKLLRLFKIIKERKNLVDFMRRLVDFSVTFELLFFFSLTFVILVHTCSCFWIFVARYNQENDQINWIDVKEVNEESVTHIYILAVYFCITTITAVGYGDVSGFSSVERLFCIFLMLLGVISFSFATGFLSQLLN